MQPIPPPQVSCLEKIQNSIKLLSNNSEVVKLVATLGFCILSAKTSDFFLLATPIGITGGIIYGTCAYVIDKPLSIFLQIIQLNNPKTIATKILNCTIRSVATAAIAKFSISVILGTTFSFQAALITPFAPVLALGLGCFWASTALIATICLIKMYDPTFSFVNYVEGYIKQKEPESSEVPLTPRDTILELPTARSSSMRSRNSSITSNRTSFKEEPIRQQHVLSLPIEVQTELSACKEALTTQKFSQLKILRFQYSAAYAIECAGNFLRSLVEKHIIQGELQNRITQNLFDLQNNLQEVLDLRGYEFTYTDGRRSRLHSDVSDGSSSQPSPIRLPGGVTTFLKRISSSGKK